MTDHIAHVRRRAGTTREVFRTVDDGSMRFLELALAFTAIAVAVLLAGARP